LLMQTNIDCDPRSLKQPLRRLDCGRIVIGRIDCSRNVFPLLQSRGFSELSPPFDVMNPKSFEGECTRESRGDASRHQCRLKGNGARPAHRIHKDFVRRPAGEPQEAGCQILPERRLHCVETIAPFEERLPGCIEIQSNEF